MIEYLDQDMEEVIAIRVIDQLNEEDYESLAQKIKEKITQGAKVRLYWEIPQEVTVGETTFWSDIHFNLKYASDIKKVALVGQAKERVHQLTKPFSTSRVRYYKLSERQQALEWIRL